jgi:hypothetical protein
MGIIRLLKNIFNKFGQKHKKNLWEKFSFFRLWGGGLRTPATPLRLLALRAEWRREVVEREREE